LRPYSRTASCQSHRFASASLVPTTSPGCGGHTRAAALTGQVRSIVERTEYEMGTATGWRMSTPRGRPLSSPCWRRRRRTTDRARPAHASRSRGFELCSSTLRVDALHRLGFGDQRLRCRGLHSPVDGSRLIRGTATELAGEPKLTCHPARSPVPNIPQGGRLRLNAPLGGRRLIKERFWLLGGGSRKSNSAACRGVVRGRSRFYSQG
jgi:hypothetical protein